MAKKPTYFIIGMSYLSLFSLGFTDNLRGALFPEILQTFSKSNSEGSWFFIFASIFSILAATASHFLCSKFSSYRIWQVGVFGIAMGGILIFGAESFFFVLFACIILGIGFGLLGVTQNLLITKTAPTKLVKKLLSGLHSMYGLSSFLSPILVSFAASYKTPWQHLFLAAGVFSLVLLVSSLPVVLPNSLEPVNVSKQQGFKVSLFTKKKFLFSIIVASYVAMEILVSTRLTTYLTLGHNWSLAQASLYLSYFFVALLMGRLLFSILHFPISTKKTLLVSLLGASLCILYGLHNNPLFISLSGFFMAPFYPLAIALMTEVFPDEISSMMGLTISLQSVFVIGMNLLMGMTTDALGIHFAMNSVFIFSGFSWLLLMFF